MKKRLLSLLLTVLMVSMTCIHALGSTVVDRDGKPVSTVVPTPEGVVSNFAYTQGDLIGTNGSTQYYGVVIPITVTSGGLLDVAIALNSTDTAKNLQAELYTDAACTTVYKQDYSTLWLSLDNYDGWKPDDDSVNIAAGTYYLKIYSQQYVYGSNLAEVFQNVGSVGITFTSSGDRTLTSGSSTTIASSEVGTYLKIVVSKSGYLHIAGNQNTTLKLCNSKKVAYSNGDGNLSSYNKYVNMFPVNAGTYYLWCKSYSEVFNIAYQFKSETTLKAGSAFTISPANVKQNFYVKIKPSKSGYITFTTNSKLSGNITLCDGKKKALSKECYIYGGSKYNSKVAFAVKKNTTYYIRVRSYEYAFTTKYSFKEVKEISGSSVKKAVSLTKGKTLSGLILPGDNTKDYYKVKLTKAQVVKLLVKGNISSGQLKIKIYSDSKLKKEIGSSSLYDYGGSTKLQSVNYSNKHKLSKGTYYIVIQRSDKYSNGNYSIQWQK